MIVRNSIDLVTEINFGQKSADPIVPVTGTAALYMKGNKVFTMDSSGGVEQLVSGDVPLAQLTGTGAVTNSSPQSLGTLDPNSLYLVVVMATGVAAGYYTALYSTVASSVVVTFAVGSNTFGMTVSGLSLTLTSGIPPSIPYRFSFIKLS